MQTALPYIYSKQGKIKVERLGFILAGVLFKIALDISYSTYLTSAFESHFLTPFPVNFSILQYMESFVWLVLVLSFVPYSSRSAGGLAFFSAIVFLYAPVASIYGMDADRSRYTLFLSALAIGVAYLFSAARVNRHSNIPLLKNGSRYLIVLCFFFVGLFLLIGAYTGALFSMNFDVSRVYELRSDQSAKIDIGILSYTNLWTQQIFTPLILAIGLQRKSVWMIVFAIIMHLIYFGVTQHRAHLFTPVLVYMVFFIYRREFSYATAFFVIALALSALNFIVMIFSLGDFGAIAIRRALFVGPSVAYSWVEYFSVYPQVYFSDRILAAFISNEYNSVNLPNLMGDHMRPGMMIAFNSGLVGAGFAQLGALGVVLYGGIIGFFIRINQQLIKSGVPPYISAVILIFPYRIAWADSDLFTALLSHGIIVGTFMVWLFGCPHNQKTQCHSPSTH